MIQQSITSFLASFNPRPSWWTGATCSATDSPIPAGVFQSSPVLVDGRNFCPDSLLFRHNVSFNPRPSWWTGATGEMGWPGTRTTRFQSSPVLVDGRNADLLPPAGRSRIVSILARPGGRAQPVLVGSPSETGGGFNPRPSWWTGATGIVLAAIQEKGRFQSSPVLVDGRNPVGVGRGSGLVDVSILARPGGRAQRTSTASSCRQRSRFNPRPSWWTGATWGDVSGVEELAGVSILARPGGRAQPDTARAIRNSRSAFQSSPVLVDGRNRTRALLRQFGYRVSILARPGGRAQPPVCCLTER